jgi:OmpA-OmpF porin, OOP family
MRTLIIICLNMVLIRHSASAQELGIEINGGLQGLKYNIANGESKLQAGGNVGINYSYPLASKFNLITGVTAGYFSTKNTLKDGAVFSSNQVDDAGSAFRLNASATGYRETQRFFTAGVPVMVQYHTSGEKQWYINAGAKFLFPFSSTVKSSANQLKLSGYYPDYNIEVDDLPKHGFGTVANWQSNSKLVLNATATLSAATGINFSVAHNMKLYTGLYLDYGLTNMKTGDGRNNSCVAYNSKNINDTKTLGAAEIADKARMLAYGIQVRIGLVVPKLNRREWR